jgi:hypothetical protein
MRRVAEVEVYRGQIVDSDPRAVPRRKQYSYVAADVHGPVLVSDLAVAKLGLRVLIPALARKNPIITLGPSPIDAAQARISIISRGIANGERLVGG